MNNFPTGAQRPATDDARAQRIEAANDLVRRTLAQHGLMPGADGAMPDLPSGQGLMEALGRAFPNGQMLQGGGPQIDLSRFGLPQGGGLPQSLGQRGLPMGRKPTPAIHLPEGAAFRSDIFAGKSGSRAYRTYVPASVGQGAEQGAAGIVLMLHGCTQTPEDFAVGTGMNALAEDHRLVVIYPEQSRGANAQSCWNWFSKGDQRRDRGEPEILAGIVRLAMADHGVDRSRTFAAGLSAGAAMAVILGETYPDLFAAIGAHSGLPFGAASDIPGAFAAMAGTSQQGAAPAATPGTDLRTIVFHGAADGTVHPSNGAAIAARAEAAAAESVQSVETGTTGGRSFSRILTADAGGAILAEHWVIEGLGHAWSGGDAGGSYADPAGPAASAEMIRFFLDAEETSR